MCEGMQVMPVVIYVYSSEYASATEVIFMKSHLAQYLN